MPSNPGPLILASTSPYRREMLERLGLPFTVQNPQVDETAAKRDLADPAAVASVLALAKARAIAALHPQATVIGSDQVAAVGDLILDKPGGLDRARQQLSRMSGQTVDLWTAVAMISPDQVREHRDRTRLTMLPLSAEQIDRYLAADQPWDCAGSFRIEQRGIALFEAIETADFTAIVGLPLLAVSRLLREAGWQLP